jgi:hypothetical protein
MIKIKTFHHVTLKEEAAESSKMAVVLFFTGIILGIQHSEVLYTSLLIFI